MSPQRLAVFLAIHTGKRKIKTVTQLADITKLGRKRVLEEGIKLAHRDIVTQVKHQGEVAYQRDNFYYAHRKDIVRRFNQPQARNESPIAPAPRRVRIVPAPRNRRPVQRRTAKRYDLFSSHASEDKAAIARPLYVALTKAGVSVWFDEAVLKLGDSLGGRIDEGLYRCRYGLVILSPKFFAKHWPKRELDGLVARETASGKKRILPIWHNLSKEQVTRFSPTLAGRLAGNSKEGIPALVKKIKEVLAD
jgi:hypothetical protein